MLGHLSVVRKGMDVGVGNFWLCHVCWVVSPWMSQCDAKAKLVRMEHPGWEWVHMGLRGIQDLLPPFISWDMLG